MNNKKQIRMSSSFPTIIRIIPSNTKKVTVPKNAAKTIFIKNRNRIKLSSDALRMNRKETTADRSLLFKTEEVQSKDHCETEYDGFEDVTNSEFITDHSDEFDVKQEQIPHSRFLKRCIESNTLPFIVKQNKTHSEQCCCSCRETLDIILQQQQEILNHLKNDSLSILKEKKLDLLPTMPFKDINDFLDFDESLNNENVQDQFILKLKKLLVSIEQKSISNIMSSIMTNELCRQISWIGIKDTTAFGTTNMVGLIVDLIQEHHQIDMDIVQGRIAEWLRRCGDRIGNELRKIKKKHKIVAHK